MTMALDIAIEVDASLISDEVIEYCVGMEISTHYDVGRARCDPSNKDDLLAKWVVERAKEEKFNLAAFTRPDGCFMVYIDPT